MVTSFAFLAGLVIGVAGTMTVIVLSVISAFGRRG